jgi:hypothetical protein
VIKANRFQAIANFKGAIGNWDRVPCSESAFLAKLHAKSVLSLFVAPRVGGPRSNDDRTVRAKNRVNRHISKNT